MVYRAQEGFVNFDSARQSEIEGFCSDRRNLSPSGKGEKEDRFGKVVASPNLQKFTEPGINFEGLSDAAWNKIKPCLEPLFVKSRKGPGRPSIDLRKAINTILYQSLTNEKWAYLPKGENWATKSVANRTLQVLKKNAVDVQWIHSFLSQK